MTKVNFVAAGQTTATVVVMVVVVFRARRATLPWRVSGTLPAESTAAQTETLSSRRLFMYETVAYVHRSCSPFHRVRLLRLRALCPRANLCVIHTSRLNDERRLFLPRAAKTSPRSRKVPDAPSIITALILKNVWVRLPNEGAACGNIKILTRQHIFTIKKNHKKYKKIIQSF